MTHLRKPSRTPAGHAMLCWLRSHKPFELGIVATLLIAGLLGIMAMP